MDGATTLAGSSPAVTVVAHDVFDSFVECLLDGDEWQRQQAVALVQGSCLPQVAPRVLPRLVEALQHPHVGVRQRARAALLAVGGPAVPALLRLLEGCPDTPLRVRLVGLLTTIGLRLGLEQQIELVQSFDLLELDGRYPASQRACARATARLRRADAERRWAGAATADDGAGGGAGPRGRGKSSRVRQMSRL